MSSRSAVRLKAMDQARQKLEDLSKQDVVAFTFIMSEEGAEMMGEETVTNEVMGLFEEHGIMELARRIRMRGQALTHRSTRAIKIEQLQEAFSTDLSPTLLPLEDMTDYDLLRTLLNDVFKVEGFGTRWKGFLFFCKISLWHFFEWLSQLSPLPSLELLLSSLEPFFE